jgi:hypothetical protein
MYNEYDGQTYYPKYSEDLVHSEVLLPDNAPKEYEDASVLWNAVEMSEKGSRAQLARTYKFSLPNEWSYDLATEVVRDYIKQNFVSEGMCAEFAIHDSENEKTHQRNLHCHVLLTMRGIDEQGKWLPKQKKVYLTDENGERIPLIDKKTGQQKVDKQNRKQWKCQTIATNDWGSRENAKRWRENLTTTINEVNAQIGNTENVWEHRSFKEQGLDLIPQIHLGEKASAMERAGIMTERGNINREIIRYNRALIQAKEMYEEAKAELKQLTEQTKEVLVSVKNEVLDMIEKVKSRKGRLDLPIVTGKHLRRISDRSAIQNIDNAQKFIIQNEIDSFDTLKDFLSRKEKKYDAVEVVQLSRYQKISRLKELSAMHQKYAPIRDIYKESRNLTGLAKFKYDREHKAELEKYPELKQKMDNLLSEGEKMTPKKWKAEIKALQADYESIAKEQSEVAMDLAYAEVIDFNKKNLERELANESHKVTKQRTHSKQKTEELL